MLWRVSLRYSAGAKFCRKHETSLRNARRRPI